MRRIGIAAAVCWVVISLLPYPFVGEYWGIAWMIMNSPLAIAFSEWEVLHCGYPYVYTCVVTFTNAVIYGYIIFCLTRLTRFLTQKRRGKAKMDLDG